MSDRVVVELASRLATFDRDEHADLLDDERAHAAAVALNGTVLADPDAHGDRVLRVLGHWFLLRHHLRLGAGQELRWARLHASLLRDRDPAALTDRLRALLDSPPDLVDRTAETALSLIGSFTTTGDPRAVESAAGLLADLPEELAELAPLGAALIELTRARVVITADPAALAGVERQARALLSRLAQDDPVRDAVVALVGTMLTARADLGGEDTLDEALRVLGGAVDPERPAATPAAASALGAALRVRFERTRGTADLDRAVELGRVALGAAGHGAPGREETGELLVFALLRRYYHLEQAADLDEALAVCRAVEPARGETGPVRCSWLSALAMVLTARFTRTGDPAELDEAVRRNREAIALAGELGLLRLVLQGNHAALLAIRHEERGDPADLAEATAAARAAVALTPADSAQLGARLLVLAQLIGTGVEPPPAEALDLLTEALRVLPAGHPSGMAVLAERARHHHRRYRATGGAEDLAAAMADWAAAARAESGRPFSRLLAAEGWMGAALTAGDLAAVAEAVGESVRLLPLLAWRGLQREVRERTLSRTGWIGGQAAALVLAAGMPERAVELVDQSRNVLWGQALQTRSDLSALRATDPALADELDRTRALIDQAEPTGATADERALAAHRAAVERWDVLLRRARALPGFADFLGPVPFSRLRHAAADGPVVVVNLHRTRSDALVVRPDGVVVVPLPWLTPDEAQGRTTALLDAIAQAGGGGPGRAHLRNTLLSLLRWLWDVVAAPVLSELDRVAGPVRHRMWWCPTGPLTLLPLHAAGRYGSAARNRPPTVPARTVSSYATGLSSLLRARQPFRPAPGLVAVGMAHTPGHPPLPAVVGELGRIAQLVPDTRVLTGPGPDEVVEALAGAGWAHFACHATQVVHRPGDSALHLDGGDLTVLRLAGCDLQGAEFAYLSACGTAGGSVALADEAIHLAAALQMAGYRHVVGTLWGVPDDIAASVAEGVYAGMARGGRLDATRAAQALTDAADRVRRDHPASPDLWAPFVHLGP
ncbi:CHAT domain-containing protein [Actinokineospora bangkokensis]|uniref:CHAT domain-containing protein n=1 Tax=Actinokineospora bangkokensis TaxID=1193682 RepID=A0A1Q9LNC3_9PSEU|nr:CHAT domain-containing protein [Actinokineospora bangkokensis]OLR93511.1 hypothetical protein BJP25_14500 [Actinokineospora bangkokensis]